MADNWRMLDLTSFKGTLRNTKNRLQVISGETGEISVEALNDINIIFIGLGVQINQAVMYHLATKDVVTLFCDWKGLPVSGMYPWVNAHGRVAARQRAQAALSLPRSKNAWSRIVKAKIRGQANNLESLRMPNAKRLRELASGVKSGDPSNIEAQAAKIYWSSLFKGECFRRMPGEGIDIRNSLLDYGYTILRGHSVRAVLSAGLTPALGLYHKNLANAFALADDLIEPYRPAIDYAVVAISPEATLSDSHVKQSLLKATLATFREDGASIPTVMVESAQLFGRYVEGEEALFSPFVWQPGLSEKV